MKFNELIKDKKKSFRSIKVDFDHLVKLNIFFLIGRHKDSNLVKNTSMKSLMVNVPNLSISEGT